VTFITPSGQWAGGLPSQLHIRRAKVYMTLCWLKKNNTVYADITISQEMLKLLPKDDVPVEILWNVHQSNDIEVVIWEHEGYVPIEVDDKGDDDDKVPSHHGHGKEQKMWVNASDKTPSWSKEGPAMILTSNAIVNVEGNNIPKSELMVNVFLNGAHLLEDHEGEHYSYWRGNDYVNEYARQRLGSNKRYKGSSQDSNHLLGCYPTLFPYGKGGFEVARTVDVSYEKHIKWSLTYHETLTALLSERIWWNM